MRSPSGCSILCCRTVPRLALFAGADFCSFGAQWAAQGRPAPARSPSMSEKSCTIRTRKFLTNRLLSRRQFVSPFIPLSTAQWVYWGQPAAKADIVADSPPVCEACPLAQLG